MRNCLFVFSCLAGIFVLLPNAGSQVKVENTQTRSRETPGPEINARGIVVGVPKVFDDRTLTLMLEGLNTSLANVNVISQQPLAQAIGTVQGSRTHEQSNALTVQGSPTPGVQSQSTQNTAPNSSGAMVTTTNNQTTTTTPSVTPGVPWNSDMATLPSAYTNLQYSMASSDLLSEQVNLMYQIFNIRMLLDRSLSDRLLWTKDPHNNTALKTRLQAVIGMNITVDPPRDAENAAAVVEVTFYRDGAKTQAATEKDGVSLVAMMPQEHTYNSAALNSKSTAFGGSAVAKVVSIGYTDRRRGQTYYLFRDNDTVSFERQTYPNSGAVTFGWVFRPVLGRKSVAPGLRQMFAVVSIPEDDMPSTSTEPIRMVANVHAYWKKYDQTTLTTAEPGEIRGWDKLLHALTLGITSPFAPGGETDIRGYDVLVPRTSSYLDGLKPHMTDIEWKPVGTQRAVVSLKGWNIFQGTSVLLGDKVYSGPGDGLRLINDQSADLTTDIGSLAAEGSLLGRYWPAQPLEFNPTAKSGLSFTPQWTPPLGGVTKVTLMPQFDRPARPGPRKTCLVARDLAPDKLGMPIISVNGIARPGPYDFPAHAPGDDCLDIVVYVPDPPAQPVAAGAAATATAAPTAGTAPVSTPNPLGGNTAQSSSSLGLVALRFPFRGPALTASARLYDPRTNFTAKNIAGKNEYQQYLVEKIDGPFLRDEIREAKGEWRLIPGGPPLPLLDVCDPSAAPAAASYFCLLTKYDRYAILNLATPAEKTSQIPAAPASPAAVPPATLASPATVLLQYGVGDPVVWESTYEVSLSASSANGGGGAKPKLDDTLDNLTRHVNQFDQIWLTFTGTALDQVGSVVSGPTTLQINPAKDGKSIAVFVLGTLTGVAANNTQIDLTFLDKQSKQIGTAHLIVASAKSGEPKK